MRYRGWVIGGLIAALVLTCGLSLVVIAGTVAGLGARFGGGVNRQASATATEAKDFTVGSPASLEVDNASGEIRITVGDSDQIEVTAATTAWGPDQAQADAELADVEVIMTQQGDTVHLEARRRSTVGVDLRTFEVMFTIQVPAHTRVDATSGSGAVSLTGTIGPAVLHSDFGDVTAEDVSGGLSLTSSSGNLTATGIHADDADVELDTDFGSITLNDVAGDSVTLTSSSGRLDLTGVTASGRVQAHTDFGDIAIATSQAASYDLTSNSGDLELFDAAGTIKAHTDFGDVRVVASGAAVLDLRTSSGDIDFEGSLGEAPHTIWSDFGRISLGLPAKTAVSVDLTTDFGEVTTDFPVTVTGHAGSGPADVSGSKVVGSLNGGGPVLTAHTNSGDIALTIKNP